MATVPTTMTEVPVQGGLFARTVTAQFSAAGTSDWVRLQNCNVTVQVDGAGTAITFTVERTTRDPATNTVTAAPADTAADGQRVRRGGGASGGGVWPGAGG